VAELTGLTRGAVSKLIDRLLTKELVSRAEASGDRRYQDIKLTSNAVKLVPKLAAIADENDESFFSVLSETEKKMLLKILSKLAGIHKLKTNPIE
ncbi:MAG: MarR family winged helix-turn-helix transcriptional regulator, partial [Pseudobdellovibrio sp.]